MKNKNILLFILSAVVLFAACDKNDLSLTQYSLPTDKAYVRFAFFSPVATGTSPTVMIKINNVKVNGATTSIGSGLFPSVVNSPDYASIDPNSTLKLSLPNTATGNDSVQIYTGTVPVDAGKFYTVVLADTGVDRTVFSVQDNLGALADSGSFKLRLVNAMAKSPTIHLIRVDSTNATTVTRDTIARNIAFKAGTDYLTQSISPKTGYSFLRYRTVTSTGLTLAAVTAPSPTTINQRSVTIYASGFATGTGNLAPNVSQSFIYNQ